MKGSRSRIRRDQCLLLENVLNMGMSLVATRRPRFPGGQDEVALENELRTVHIIVRNLRLDTHVDDDAVVIVYDTVRRICAAMKRLTTFALNRSFGGKHKHTAAFVGQHLASSFEELKQVLERTDALEMATLY